MVTLDIRVSDIRKRAEIIEKLNEAFKSSIYPDTYAFESLGNIHVSNTEIIGYHAMQVVCNMCEDILNKNEALHRIEEVLFLQ